MEVNKKTVYDIEQKYGVNAKRSVLALGLNEDATDANITEVLKTYGTVVKIVRLRLSEAIIELDAEEAVEHLKPNFPCEIATAKYPTAKWCVDDIEKVLLSPVFSQSPSEMNAEETASEQDVGESSSSDSEETESDNTDTALTSKGHQRQTQATHAINPSHSKQSEKSAKSKRRALPTNTASLSADILNPQDVQRLIVEHVIKNEASSSSLTPKRLRSFSGRVPKPPGEVDFETWFLHVELMFQDGFPVDIQRRMILESLLSPALDIVKQLGSHSYPQEYVRLLQSAYGLVDDGEEIFAKFLSIHQDAGERASEYLQRLQAVLSTAIKRGGVSEVNANKQLYKQFIRGCWDQTLLLTLQQRFKSESPPDFSELLLQLRTEEERRSVKIDRMQRHFGSSKVKPSLHFQTVPEPPLKHDHDIVQKYITETESLRKQVAELQMQLTEKRSQRRERRQQKTTEIVDLPPVAAAEMHVQQPACQPAPKAWFCFKCGETGHIARQCENPPNKELVDKKYKELKEKRRQWEARYGTALNWTGFQ